MQALFLWFALVFGFHHKPKPAQSYLTHDLEGRISAAEVALDSFKDGSPEEWMERDDIQQIEDNLEALTATDPNLPELVKTIEQELVSLKRYDDFLQTQHVI